MLYMTHTRLLSRSKRRCQPWQEICMWCCTTWLRRHATSSKCAR